MSRGLVGRRVSKPGVNGRPVQATVLEVAYDGDWRMLVIFDDGRMESRDPTRWTVVSEPTSGPYR